MADITILYYCQNKLNTKNESVNLPTAFLINNNK